MGRRRRRDRDHPARRPEHRRDQGGRGTEHLARGRRLRDAAPARDHRLRPHLQPDDPRRQRPLGRRADVELVLRRDPGGDDRLHGDRNDLEPVRGGARPAAGHPALDPPRRHRRLRDLLHAAADRPLGAPGAQGRGQVPDAPRPPARGRRLRERPGARARQEPQPARRARARARDLRRRARGDDPARGDERRRDRRLADHVRDGQLPAAARGLPPAAQEVRNALAGARRLRGDRLDRGHPARPDEVPGDDVRVRRDAVVHDRPRGGRRAPRQGSGTRSSSTARVRTSGSAESTGRCSRSSAASAPPPRGS